MPYITEQQLIDRYGEDELIQLTDRERVGDINTEVLAEAIADAESIIDSKLKAAGYSLPLSQVVIDSSPLKRFAGDVVRYLLMDDGATENVTRRYDDALTWLNGLAKGVNTLGEQDTSSAAAFTAVAGKGKSGIDWGTH
jgi:phage gp36-like protein